MIFMECCFFFFFFSWSDIVWPRCFEVFRRVVDFSKLFWLDLRVHRAKIWIAGDFSASKLSSEQLLMLIQASFYEKV